MVLFLMMGLTISPTALSARPTLSALSPDTLNSAELINAPISEVLVLSDAAVVTRTTQTLAGPVARVVRLPDLPPSAREVQVSAERDALVRVTQRRVQRSDLDLKALEEHLSALEGLEAEARLLAAEATAPRHELAWLTALSPDLSHQSSAWRSPPSFNDKSLKVWAAFRSLVEARTEVLRERLRGLEGKLNTLTERDQLHRAAATALINHAHQREVLSVVALLHAPTTQEVKLTLSYTLSGVQWSPSYELHVDVGRSEVRRAFGAMVSQNTGEDWRDTQLTFSTRRYQQRVTRPKLVSWTLGESKDFHPQLRAARTPNRSPLFPPPQAQVEVEEGDTQARQRLEERYRRLTQAGLLGRGAHAPTAALLNAAEASGLLTHATGLSGRGVGSSGGSSGGSGGLGVRGTGYGGGGRGRATRRPSAKRRPSPRRAPSPPPPPPSYPSSAPAQSFADDLIASAESAPRAPQARSRASTTSLTPVSASRPGASIGGLSVYDGVSYATPPVMIGASYRFKAPNVASVMSGQPAVVVPVEVSTQALELTYEATPALSPHAYLSGALTHKSERPLLAGPATLFSSGAFVGETHLSTILKGQRLEVPLGADSDIKLDRRVEVNSREEGFFGAQEISVYPTKLQVANYKRRAITVKLYDVLPISEHKEVKVTLKQMAPEGVIDDPKRGVICWTLDLKAGARRDVTLVYQVSRPKGWRVFQR